MEAVQTKRARTSNRVNMSHSTILVKGERADNLSQRYESGGRDSPIFGKNAAGHVRSTKPTPSTRFVSPSKDQAYAR